MENSSKTLRILCFGDSLTAGWSVGGMRYDPYSEHLQGPLERLLPSTNVIIDVDGVPGDRVIAPPGQYLRRMNARCAKAVVAPYDWFIVMGGTNDLGWGSTPEEIYASLERVWEVSLKTGAKVLALNVTECGVRNADLLERRHQLNEMIASHNADRWYFFDICAAVPYFAMDEKTRDEIWDDGLHLTKNGYKRMGDAVAARMIELLSDKKG